MSIREQLSEERRRLQKEGSLPDWFTTDGYSLFKQKYAVKGEDSFRGRARTIAKTAAQYLEDPEVWEERFFDLIFKGWLSCSTPVLSNMGTNKGMPVSCSGGFVGDSVDDFYTSLREAAILSKNGFGTSGYFGGIRPRGSAISTNGKASGSLPVFEDFVTMSRKISQGGTRRGAYAGYLPVGHGDFYEWVDFVKEVQDDVNVGWCWTDEDTAKMQAGDEEQHKRFRKMLKLKMLTGKGYIFKPDTVNRLSPQMYKDLGLIVSASNLCCEISLFSDLMHTFTCVLASMNLSKYNEWKDTKAIFYATVFLDCVAEDFIRKAKEIPGLERAVRFTEKGRALGLGFCGFHTYLQQEMIPFESLQAQFFNSSVTKELHDESLKASQWLAETYGEPEWCKGYGVRNTHRTAMMPTMSTALIMGGVSQGIEPIIGNVFIQSGAGGESERINPVFLSLMKKRGKYTKKLVKHICDNNGSVQDLEWLTDEEKLVFRTAFEINQEVILRLASQRQQYICQGQSLNLFFSAEESEEYIAEIHQKAILDDNIKGLYYIRTQAGVQASTGECIACQ